MRAAHLARTQRARGASDRASAARGEEMEEREGIEEGRGRRGREQRERGVTGGLERRRGGGRGCAPQGAPLNWPRRSGHRLARQAERSELCDGGSEGKEKGGGSEEKGGK